jgi:hypothetical protein
MSVKGGLHSEGCRHFSLFYTTIVVAADIQHTGLAPFFSSKAYFIGFETQALSIFIHGMQPSTQA